MSEPTTGEKPIIYADASSLKNANCERHLIYNNYYGFRGGAFNRNYKAAYGSAIHRALEYWYGFPLVERNKDKQREAIEIASKYYQPYTIYISNTEKEFRTTSHLVKVMEKYFELYNQDSESLEPIKGLLTPGLLETKFTYPAVMLDERLKSPYFELIIAGTIDMIAGYMGGEIFVDHKSTGTYWGYKDEFFREYDLSIQMELYTLILWKLTGRIIPYMINGIFIKSVTQKAEKAGEFDGVNFERYGPNEYSREQLEEFQGWLVERLVKFKNECEYQWINKDVAHLNPAKLTRPNFSACHPKFGCPYISVCSKNPSEQGRILKTLNREQYNPLTFSESL